MAKLFIVLVLCLIPEVSGHGRLMEPPGRSSAWRLGFNTPRNVNDNQLYCGGLQTQQKNGGKCGVCGDPYDGVRENEAGGKYATGTIVRNYTMGQVITAMAELTANHKGWFEYRICPNNDIHTAVTHECLDQHLLERADGQGTRLNIPAGIKGNFTMRYKLPEGMVCSQCVIQWRYHAGNTWGTDPDGHSCTGCGPQEEFYGCADVSIYPSDGLQVSMTTHSLHFTTFTSSSTSQPTSMLPPLTQRPTTRTQTTPTTSTTQRPTTKSTINAVQRTSGRCHAIGGWAGQAMFDEWCNINCVRNYCPPEDCKCDDTDNQTPQPTTQTNPKTSQLTTQSVYTTFVMMLTRAPTTSLPVTSSVATTTTQRATPAVTTTKSTQPPTTLPTARTYSSTQNGLSSTSSSTKLISTSDMTSTSAVPSQSNNDRMVCKAIGESAGNRYLDRWCTETCKTETCPESYCRCTTVQIIETVTTSKPEMTTTNKTDMTSSLKPEMTTTVKQDLPLSTSDAASSTKPGTSIIYSHCVTNGVVAGDYWERWCQAECDRGYCSTGYCTCT